MFLKYFHEFILAIHTPLISNCFKLIFSNCIILYLLEIPLSILVSFLLLVSGRLCCCLVSCFGRWSLILVPGLLLPHWPPQYDHNPTISIICCPTLLIFDFSWQAISIEIKHDDKIPEDGVAFVQCALLYTSVAGQRKLRVHNLSFNCCSQLAELYRCCELDTLTNYLLKHCKCFYSCLHIPDL